MIKPERWECLGQGYHVWCVRVSEGGVLLLHPFTWPGPATVKQRGLPTTNPSYSIALFN